MIYLSRDYLLEANGNPASQIYESIASVFHCWYTSSVSLNNELYMCLLNSQYYCKAIPFIFLRYNIVWSEILVQRIFDRLLNLWHLADFTFAILLTRQLFLFGS